MVSAAVENLITTLLPTHNFRHDFIPFTRLGHVIHGKRFQDRVIENASDEATGFVRKSLLANDRFHAFGQTA